MACVEWTEPNETVPHVNLVFTLRCEAKGTKKQPPESNSTPGKSIRCAATGSLKGNINRAAAVGCGLLHSVEQASHYLTGWHIQRSTAQLYNQARTAV